MPDPDGEQAARQLAEILKLLRRADELRKRTEQERLEPDRPVKQSER